MLSDVMRHNVHDALEVLLLRCLDIALVAESELVRVEGQGTSAVKLMLPMA